MWPPSEPDEGRNILFLPRNALGGSMTKHGIAGVFADGRYWSSDGADHWTQGEVLCWQYSPTTAKVLGKKPTVLITDEMVSAATMVLLNVPRNLVEPDKGWYFERRWTIEQVRDLMRAALMEALK